jgi:hypothetical protein
MIMNNNPINKIMYLSLYGTLDVELHVGWNHILAFKIYMNMLQLFNEDKNLNEQANNLGPWSWRSNQWY